MHTNFISKHDQYCSKLLERKNIETISRLILTASGGPFRLRAIEEMSKVTPNEALVHPNWKMGPKISIDSATMMNKGFELIEAYHIFDFNEDKIDIVIHTFTSIQLSPRSIASLF